ncbi:fibronectin type III domain-containing protein [Nonomuraea sp. NPDC001699]
MGRWLVRIVLAVLLTVAPLTGLTGPAAQAAAGGSVAGAAAAADPPGPGRYFGTRVRVASNVAIAAGATLTVTVAGVGGVPASGVSAVALNVAAKGATALGAVHVFPADLAADPNATGARYRSGVWEDELLIVKTSPDGKLKLRNTGAGAVNVYADVHGYFLAQAGTAGAGYVPVDTARVIANQSVAANATASFPVTGLGGIPAGAAYVAFNLVIKSTGSGKTIVYPSGTTAPTGSNMDYRPSAFMSNLVIVAPGADGKITISNQGAAALTVYADVTGYFAAGTGAAMLPLTPARLANSVSVAAGATYTVTPVGAAGIPAAGVSGVAAQVTAKSTVAGLLRIHPSGQSSVPGGGSVAFQASDEWADAVPVRLGQDGKFVVKNTGTAAITLSVDVFGYFLTRPQAPVTVTATPGDGSAAVAWKQPAGGAAVTSYTVTALPGGATATVAGGQLKATVTGLDNDTEYAFRVTATGAAGAGPDSASSAPVTPHVPNEPGRPFVSAARPRDGAALVTWTPPDSGAETVTKYLVETEPGGAVTEVPGDANETIVTGLTNGTAYTFTVSAVNAAGTGRPSWPSTAVTPAPAEPPFAPPNLTAVPRAGQIVVSWAAPPDGGSPITGYTVTADPGGAAVEAGADATTATLSGLTNGTAYTVSVVARNKAGAGEPGKADPVTPAATVPPAAPAGVRAGVTADGAVTVEWDAPADPGSAAITGYKVTAAPGGATATVTATTAVISGLATTTPYTFTVVATSAAGTGPASPATEPVTPKLTVRSQPVALSAAAIAAMTGLHADGTLTFENPPAQVTALQPGTLVTLPPSASAPNGLLGRVLRTYWRDGLFVVMTKDASLAEAYDAADFAMEGGIDGGASFVPSMAGVKARAAGGPSVGWRKDRLVLELGFSYDAGGHNVSKVEGWVELYPRYKLSGSTGDVKFTQTLKIASELRVKQGISKDVLDKRFVLGHANGPCKIIKIGYVIVPVCLRFEAAITIKSTISVGLTYSVHYEKVFGVTCKSSRSAASCDPVNTGTGLSWAKDVGVYEDLEATIAFPFDVQFLFFRLTGPAVVITPYVQLKADTTQDPCWEIRGGAALGIAYSVTPLNKDLVRYSNDTLLPLFWWTIAMGGPFRGFTVNPSMARAAPNQNVSFSLSPAPGSTVQWSVPEGPGSVDSSGTYVSAQEGEAVVDAYAPPQGSDPPRRGRAAVIVGTRYGTPSTPTLNGWTHPGVKDISVSWQPPANPGGSPITDYVITATPTDKATPFLNALFTRTVYAPGDATHQLIQDLVPGTPYVVTVAARNSSAGIGPFAQPMTVTPVDLVFGPPSRGGYDLAVASYTSPDRPGVLFRGLPDTTGDAGRLGGTASGDLRYVFFVTQARSNLAPAEVRKPADYSLYHLRKDTRTGQIDVVSRGLDGRTPIAGSWAGNYRVSNDGNVIAFAYAEGKVLVHNISAGTTWAADDGARLVDVSDDGRTVLYYKSIPGHAFEYNLWRQVQGAAPVQLDAGCTTGADAEVCVSHFGSMSGDGNKVVFDTWDSEHWYRSWLSVGGGTPTQLFPADGVVLDPVISRDGSTLAVEYTPIPSGQEGLAVVPITAAHVTTANIVVPHDSTKQLSGNSLALSPNGKWLAFQWFDGAGVPSSLRVANVGQKDVYSAAQTAQSTPKTAMVTDGGVLVYTLGELSLSFGIPGVYAEWVVPSILRWPPGIYP